MPYSITYKPRRDGKNWAIVNKERGEIIGRSTSRKKAQASVRARYAGENKRGKPGRRKG